MPDIEETKRLMAALENNRPKKMFEHFDKDSAGIMCVLRFLMNVGRPVSAGEISTFMQVSTARVAVLIKKMEAKKIIEKTTDPTDARKTIISIAAYGEEKIKQHDEAVSEFFSNVIDRVGVEKFNQFIELSAEIKTVIEEEMSSYDDDFTL